jgi:hypothetical protein
MNITTRNRVRAEAMTAVARDLGRFACPYPPGSFEETTWLQAYAEYEQVIDRERLDWAWSEEENSSKDEEVALSRVVGRWR